jgi:ABC-type Mn2+/Zn2+ transport system ATPase subunit
MNGAGKTTQLQIITGTLQPDSGSVIKEKANMKISYLTQEFDVVPTRTVRVSDFLPPSTVPCTWMRDSS